MWILCGKLNFYYKITNAFLFVFLFALVLSWGHFASIFYEFGKS